MARKLLRPKFSSIAIQLLLALEFAFPVAVKRHGQTSLPLGLTMSFYDIIMLVVLLGTMIFGYWKGLAWQIASVAAVVVSYIAAFRFRDQVAQFVQAEPPFNRIAAMLIIFVSSSLIIWLAYAYVNRSLEKAELDGFNRQMGALVGAVTGVLLCMVVTLFSVSLLGQTAHDSIFQSKFGPYVVRGISMVRSVVPEELRASLDPHFANFQNHPGYDLDQPITSGFQVTPVPGGSQYPNGQMFTPNSQPSFQGGWSASPVQPVQTGYQNPNNGFQPTNQTQTGFGYQPTPNNQGTNYIPQQQYQQQQQQYQQQQFPQQQQQFQQQPQSQAQAPSLPKFQLNLDAETLLNGAGQLFKNSVSNPNGN